MKGRALIAGCVSVAVTVGLLELTCLFLFQSLAGWSFGYDAARENLSLRTAELQAVLAPPEEPKTLYVFHPYLGYSGRPGVHPWGEHNPPFNEYGMLSVARHSYPYRKQPRDFVVAVLGGSVAEGFANLAEAALNEAVRAIDPSFDRNLVLISLATGGYKQPQQLFHLQYALLSGFDFDAVLNIDGFNDLVLAIENLDKGIHPVYPSGFHLGLMSTVGTGGRLDPSTAEQLSRYYALHRRELRLVTLVSRAPLRYSVFLNLVGEQLSARSEAGIKQAEYQMAIKAQESLGDEFRGPAWDLPLDRYRDVAEIWRRSSEMLYAVATTQGLPYVHVLQPNQYVDGSKLLSANERAIAFDPENVWGQIVREGYRYLVSAGEQLKTDGVPFQDLTGIFSQHTGDLYIDVCCHFSSEGNAIMARHIARLLVRAPGQDS